MAVDATGTGSQFAERLHFQHGSVIIPVTFTLKSKEGLVTGLKLGIDRRRVRVPRDPDLRRDVLALRRIVTEAGNVRYDAARGQHGHADRAWALALAIHAAGGATGDSMALSPHRLAATTAHTCTRQPDHIAHRAPPEARPILELLVVTKRKELDMTTGQPPILGNKRERIDQLISLGAAGEEDRHELMKMSYSQFTTLFRKRYATALSRVASRATTGPRPRVPDSGAVRQMRAKWTEELLHWGVIKSSEREAYMRMPAKAFHRVYSAAQRSRKRTQPMPRTAATRRRKGRP